jgi:hypothetical protein
VPRLEGTRVFVDHRNRVRESQAAAVSRSEAMPVPSAAHARRSRRSEAIATNRRARHDYEVLERVEAGLVRRSEVQSLRAGKAS